MLLLTDLDFEYPPELVATEPSRPTRVAFTEPGAAPAELTLEKLLEKFEPGDLLVLNDSKVLPARVFSQENVEILFLKPLSSYDWSVLFPAREFKVGDTLALPGGVEATLVGKGLPQTLALNKAVDQNYFDTHGEMALPPYIQEARQERRNRPTDMQWYQTAWAAKPGSVAAPTASLHFQTSHLEALLKRGVHIERLTLHVGAGTFFPIRTNDLNQHQMHSEHVEIPRAVKLRLEAARKAGRRVWALGTTVARALESMELGLLDKTAEGYRGETRLFLKPPQKFQAVGGLLTNFHQPRSTLLALVAAFAGLEQVKATYSWAIQQRFKLFSYGDLSAWIPPR